MKSADEPRKRGGPEEILKRFADPQRRDAEPPQPFDEARPRSREDIMLDIRLTGGQRVALSYAFLAKVEYQPGDILRLHFDADVVRIEGRRLLGVYELLRQHRAKYVQEGSAEEDEMRPEEASHIDAIRMETKKDDGRSTEETNR